jgi:hypothetical protein
MEYASLPSLDLSKMFRLGGLAPHRVLDLLVEGLPAEMPGFDQRSESWGPLDGKPEAPYVFRFWVEGKALGPFRVRTVEEAWAQAFERKLIPDEWRNDPLRVFADPQVTFFCRACGGLGATGYNLDDLCMECNGKGRTVAWGSRATPTDRATVKWMCWAPEIVLEAEALARSAVERLGVGSGSSGSVSARICWGRTNDVVPPQMLAAVWESPIAKRVALPAELSPDWNTTWEGKPFQKCAWWPEANRLGEMGRKMLLEDVARAAGFQAGQASGRIPAGPNPFEPLLKLWELGVVFEELNEDAIVLDQVFKRVVTQTWRAGVPAARIPW